MASRELLEEFVRSFPAEAERAASARKFLATTRGDPTSRKNPDGHFTGSAILLSAWPATEDVETLLIFHKRLSRWLQPGGHMEAGETPLEAARREAIEELGLPAESLQPVQIPASGEAAPIDIDSHPIPGNPRKGEGPHIHHDLLYLFIVDRATAVMPQLAEVTEARWFPLKALLAPPFDPADRLPHVATRLLALAR